VDNGGFERLLAHPVLPLVAGLEAAGRTVRVWSWEGREPRELAVVELDNGSSVSWHPREARLVVAGPVGLLEWTPATGFVTTQIRATYREVAFSPDGSTLWAWPSTGEGDRFQPRSDALDLTTGELLMGLNGWDTGIVAHPAGGLLLTFSSDQGATLGIFAQVNDTQPQTLRVLRRALILDADGYRAPVISPDGRFIAIRGNNYEQLLYVFEFPSLRKLLALPFGEPSPGYPYSPEWLAEQRSWSHHNLAFAADSSLLIGTPQGIIVQCAPDGSQVVGHDLLDGAAVTALTIGAGGIVLVATAATGVRVLDPLERAPVQQVDSSSSRSSSLVPRQSGTRATTTTNSWTSRMGSAPSTRTTWPRPGPIRRSDLAANTGPPQSSVRRLATTRSAAMVSVSVGGRRRSWARSGLGAAEESVSDAGRDRHEHRRLKGQ